ncbi:MAG: 2-dehydro-3-deoxygalactonokinase [Devosia sp.]
MSANIDWIAVDWGTSNVRAWGIAADGAIAFEASSDKGMSRLTPPEFPAVLETLASAADLGSAPLDVVICGMAGARQGWLEAPYLETPANLATLSHGAVFPEGAHAKLRPRILPGICQRSPQLEDVMRGEETQLLGLVTLRPGFEGTVILPGTHSKWVEIRDGRIVRFSSAMTGELFETLSLHTVLRHSLAGETTGPDADAGLSDGFAWGWQEPQELTSLLFRTRAAALLSGKSPAWCSGYLSGLLIGAEFAAHDYWIEGQEIVPVIGSPRLTKIYSDLLERIVKKALVLDPTEVTIAGLTAARAQPT